MNANDMLDIIGEIKGSYVLEAQKYREEQGRPRFKVRILLIAAIVSVLLTGCAVVYALRLENMKVGQTEIPRPQGFETVDNTDPVTLNILSLQGIQGSPSYQAAKEWFDFQQSYHQELGAQPLTEEEQQRYISYACYDRTMADKLDEIAAKYGLKLHGEWFHEIDMKEAYSLLEISGIMRQETMESYGGGMFFQDGSFRQEGGFTAPDCPWPHPVSYSYQYTRKDIFDDVHKGTGDLSQFDQWTYTTGDGNEVLLALGPNYAMIFADQEEGFVSIDISNDDYPTPFAMEKPELEAVAELFDFTICPQPLDEAEVETARRLQDAAVQARMEGDPWIADSYSAFAKSYLSNIMWNKMPKLEYAIRDVNGDGTEDFVIFINRKVDKLVTMKDGKTREFGGNGRPWVWCEGDFFIDRFNYGDYGNTNLPADDVVIIRQFDGLQKKDVRLFQHVDSRQWKELDPFTDIPIADLTDEEFRQIMDSYVPMDLDTLGLKPLQLLAES